MKKRVVTHELLKRLLFTLLILVVYFLGRNILLFKVDASAYKLVELDSQNIMDSVLGGDRNQYTLFALGIMPVVMSSLIISVYMIVRGKEYRSHVSRNMQESWQFRIALVISIIYAYSRANSLIFVKTDINIFILKIIASLEMILGTIIVYYITDKNKEFGIGNHTPFILLNIADGFVRTISNHEMNDFVTILPECILVALAVFILDNVIIKLPVQRVSIHNEYADKDYIGFKLNPMGVMPVMFASTFLTIPQLIIKIILYFDKNNIKLRAIESELDLNHLTGIYVFLGIIFALSIFLPLIFLSPSNIAEELQKGGDSIVGVYAGKKTRRYISFRLLILCVFSGLILCSIMGASLMFSLSGDIIPELALFPSSIMFLVSNATSLFEELITYSDFDSYRFFM